MLSKGPDGRRPPGGGPPPTAAMRVRPRRTAPPFLNRRDQRRMLGLAGALAVTLFAASWAANPGNWHWIAPPAADAVPAGDEDRFAADLRGGRPAGTFRAVAAPPDGAGDDDGDDLARLPDVLTAAAEQRTVGLSRAERFAADVILARLRDLDAADLRKAADPVAFPVLVDRPAAYRGRAVTLTGTARGVRDLPGRGAAGEEVGTAEVWFFPPDSANHPVRALANAAPGLPRGERLAEGVPVRATGYFFKLEGYEAESGPRVAPLILADAVVRLEPYAAVPATPAALPWVVLAAVAGACGVGGLLVWRWRAGDRAFERSTLGRFRDAAGEATAPSADAGEDPGAFLAGLSGADEPLTR